MTKFIYEDPYDAKYQFYIKKRKLKGLKNLNNYKALLNARMMWIVFDDMIADILNNKKLNPVVTELFIRGRKLNISFIFVTQFYFAVPKNID